MYNHLSEDNRIGYPYDQDFKSYTKCGVCKCLCLAETVSVDELRGGEICNDCRETLDESEKLNAE